MKYYIHPHNDKFINNIIISLRNIYNTEVFSYPSKDNLYRLYNKFKFDAAIFVSSSFDNEIAQFISEFYSSGMKIFVYHDLLNKDIIEYHSAACKNITYESGIKNSIQINDMINDDLYTDKKNKKNEQICCFLENQKVIPEELINYLYPNTKLPIKLFNNPIIKHPQNLGILTEFDKADVLNESEFFLDIDNFYKEEAIRCGCKIVDMKNITNYKKTKKIKPNNKYKTYKNFIDTHLL